MERLHNQLVGPYLRDARSQFGLFLLVWRGVQTYWRAPEYGKLSFSQLVARLAVKTEDILRSRVDLKGIYIVGIDLTKRDTRQFVAVPKYDPTES